jgi:hypothetical protein
MITLIIGRVNKKGTFKSDIEEYFFNGISQEDILKKYLNIKLKKGEAAFLIKEEGVLRKGAYTKYTPKLIIS